MREILAQGLGDGRHKYTSEGEKGEGKRRIKRIFYSDI